MLDGTDHGPGKSRLRGQVFADAVSAVIVAVTGFVFLNLAFIAFAGFYNLASMAMRSFSGRETVDFERFDPSILGWVFLLLVTVVFWLVYKSKLHVVIKASFLMVPFATSLVLIGIAFYGKPSMAYVVSGLASAALLLLLYRRKENWLYFFSTALVIVMMLIMNLTGTEI